jgi:tryptophan halogenase
VGWIQVMEGQNLRPQRHHPLAELKDEQATAEYLEGVREVVAKCVDFMPDHAAYIAEHCASPRR